MIIMKSLVAIIPTNLQLFESKTNVKYIQEEAAETKSHPKNSPSTFPATLNRRIAQYPPSEVPRSSSRDSLSPTRKKTRRHAMVSYSPISRLSSSLSSISSPPPSTCKSSRDPCRMSIRGVCELSVCDRVDFSIGQFILID